MKFFAKIYFISPIDRKLFWKFNLTFKDAANKLIIILFIIWIRNFENIYSK